MSAIIRSMALEKSIRELGTAPTMGDKARVLHLRLIRANEALNNHPDIRSRMCSTLDVFRNNRAATSPDTERQLDIFFSTIEKAVTENNLGDKEWLLKLKIEYHEFYHIINRLLAILVYLLGEDNEYIKPCNLPSNAMRVYRAVNNLFARSTDIHTAQTHPRLSELIDRVPSLRRVIEVLKTDMDIHSLLLSVGLSKYTASQAISLRKYFRDFVKGDQRTGVITPLRQILYASYLGTNTHHYNEAGGDVPKVLVSIATACFTNQLNLKPSTFDSQRAGVLRQALVYMMREEFMNDINNLSLVDQDIIDRYGMTPIAHIEEDQVGFLINNDEISTSNKGRFSDYKKYVNGNILVYLNPLRFYSGNQFVSVPQSFINALQRIKDGEDVVSHISKLLVVGDHHAARVFKALYSICDFALCAKSHEERKLRLAFDSTKRNIIKAVYTEWGAIMQSGDAGES